MSKTSTCRGCTGGSATSRLPGGTNQSSEIAVPPAELAVSRKTSRRPDGSTSSAPGRAMLATLPARAGYLAATLRYRATASGAKIAMSANTHTNAIHRSEFAGVPIQNDRTASDTVVKGFASANWRSPSGIDSTGTKIDEANVSGKIAVKPIAFAVSGEDEKSPTSAKIHENAYPSSRHSTSPAT